MNKNKEIQIRCHGSRELPYDKLKTFQGNLKEMTKENCRKLKGSILKYGWCAPVFVWGENYILDGHGRLLVLAELLKEGYSIGALPVVDIEADTKKLAGEILLAINSKYQTITDQGLYEFMETMEIGFDELGCFELSDINLEKFAIEYYKEPEKPLDYNTVYEVVISCGGESEQKNIYELLTEKGYKCRVLTL